MSHASRFRELHRPGDPVVLVNVWDAGSARTVAGSGAPALATGSASVAGALGFEDGEALPLPLALENLRRIVAAVDLPVTLDLERGYGATPAAVGETVAAAWAAGAVGCNLEDGLAEGGLRSIDEQGARYSAARDAAPDMFINARTDIFLQAPAETHGRAMLEAALERARAYAGAGADGLFLPLLKDEALIARACERSPLPVNIMAFPGVPGRARLAELGVARISHGPGPWRAAMGVLEQAARAALA